MSGRGEYNLKRRQGSITVDSFDSRVRRDDNDSSRGSGRLIAPPCETVPVIKMLDDLDDDMMFPTQSLKVHEPMMSSRNSPPAKRENATIVRPPRDRGNTRSARKMTRPPPVDPDEVSSVAESLLNEEPVADDNPAVIAETVTVLEDRRDALVMSGNFMESLRLQRAVDRAKDVHLKSMKKDAQTKYLNEIIQKRAGVEQAYDKCMDRIRRDEEELERRGDEYAKTVKARQAKEIEDHDVLWQSEAVRRRYNRTSNELRRMRLQQERLMKARRYDEAEEIAKMAAVRERDECQESYRLMVRDYQLSRQQLEARHGADMDDVDSRIEMRRREFDYTTGKATKRYSVRMDCLKNEEESGQDSERIWNRRGRHRSNQVKTRRRVVVAKSADVNEFNKLRLPPLPLG